jgi:molecular chaperone IbpA|tara:strand:+ start:304 stop:711 length:408 start_codon:yes stop_codon:yes gene_type:complete
MHDLINLNKFLTKSIGFEDVFNRFFELQDFNGGHPFYNIKRIKDDKYVLEMALAGYKKSEVKVDVTDGVLSIKGNTGKEADEYVHRGISKRSFAKQLQLSEYVECKGAKLEDGMLKVDLEYNPPENKRPKTIEVK